LKAFYESAKGLSAEERGMLLVEDQNITEIHQDVAEGQTEEPSAAAEENTIFHYVALTRVGDELYELDGIKNYPICHGKTSDESFLADAANVCKTFIERDEDELRFTVMAIVARDDQIAD
jgi:ubiquitin carboxyl-terminal hydrolase L3